MAATSRPLCNIELRVVREFEACLSLSWSLPGGTTLDSYAKFVVEMVIDHGGQGKRDGQLQPPKGAMVKRVEMGRVLAGNIQSMPSGRRFFVAVVGKKKGGQQNRSEWISAATLSPETRENVARSVDPMNVLRAGCELCSCAGYVPMFSANSLTSQADMFCRHCGCKCTEHVEVEVHEILQKREEKLREKLGKEKVHGLPEEALEWDMRECALWAWTQGSVHPRTTVGQHRRLPEGGQLPVGGLEGLSGKKGRVSVVTPTTESRHRFHKTLWSCFEAQTWPDKELVVVETYTNSFSDFFFNLAMKDSRIQYVKFQRKPGKDWSIGLKRNIGTHIATGEFIANFDDDDLYAPVYLTSMVSRLEDSGKQAIKMSSWFIFHESTSRWAFCDPIAWGLSNGLGEDSQDVKSWAYGYGFSYVFRRKVALDVWYDDINLGEDFGFITLLQQRRGAGSVLLLHDDFGICLHVQHGGNTSNSIPLREVEREEALSLDVVELAPHLDADSRVGGFLDAATPPSKRRRWVRAHLSETSLNVECAVSATAADFLRSLGEQLGGDCSSMRVYRVPPQDGASELARNRAAVDVLGLAFLVRRPGVEENIREGGKCGRQWRQLLDSACAPMGLHDRVGLRTKELWVRPLEPGSEDMVVDTGEREAFITVGVSCQKTTAKKFFSLSTNAAQVRVPAGSTVAGLRAALGWHLPAHAKVTVERGKGVITLQEQEPVPDAVTVTDFKGQRGFYTKFSVRETSVALQMIKAFFMRPENQTRLDDFASRTRGSDVHYTAMVCEVLAQEVYPPILRRFELPEEKPLQVVMDAMETVLGSKELIELWFETEVLMRNTVKISEAVKHCQLMGVSVVQVLYRVLSEHPTLQQVQDNTGALLQSILAEQQPESSPDDAEVLAPEEPAEDLSAEPPAKPWPEGDASTVAEEIEAAPAQEWTWSEQEWAWWEQEWNSQEQPSTPPRPSETPPSAQQPPAPLATASPAQPWSGQQTWTLPGQPGQVQPEPPRAKATQLAQGKSAEALYEVVHERLFLRRKPATDATVVGAAIRGSVLRGEARDVNGNPWLLLDQQSRSVYANSRMDAWALMHGSCLGLGELVVPVQEGQVQVVVRHGYSTGEVRLLVPQDCTMLDVKQALSHTLGRELPRMKLVTRNNHATFSYCKDVEPLGERRELLVIGESLSAK